MQFIVLKLLTAFSIMSFYFAMGSGVLQAATPPMSPDQIYEKAGNYQLNGEVEKAFTLLTMAAEQGHAEAQFNLGHIYFSGGTIEQDYQKALDWYLKSANQGNTSAQLGIATLYTFGFGVAQDEEEAVKWLERAAIQGHANAQYNLGIAYEKGEGVVADLAKAFAWYKRAAKQGVGDAQFLVGIMYAGGLGTKQDMIKAYRWVSKAADQGIERAKGAKARLKSTLTPAQLNLALFSEGDDYDISGPNIIIPNFQPIPETIDE